MRVVNSTTPPPSLDAEQLLAHLTAQIRQEITSTGRQVHLVGVHSGGAWIAERLHANLKLTTPLGFLSSAFHRDDFDERGLTRNIKPSNLPFAIDGTDLIVVDDVLFTGRTVRAVLNELFDHGRAQRIEMAVLIDRGGRELPVTARYVGAVVHLTNQEQIQLSQDTSGRLSVKVEPCVIRN